MTRVDVIREMLKYTTAAPVAIRVSVAARDALSAELGATPVELLGLPVFVRDAHHAGDTIDFDVVMP